MKVGDHVRVMASTIVYHYPQHKKQPFDLKGMKGEIVGIITDWQGRPVSSNFPILVKFDKRFKAHFRDHELEVLKPE